MQKGRVRSDEVNQVARRVDASPIDGLRSAAADIARNHYSEGAVVAIEAATDQIGVDSRPEMTSPAFSAAVDAAIAAEDAQGHLVTWKLLYFTPAVAAIVAGAVLQARQNRSRRRLDDYELSYEPF